MSARLRNFQELDIGDRWSLSRNLVTARRRNLKLDVELPIVAKAYEQHVAAFRRMSAIRKAAGKAGLSANVIVNSGFAIGVATAQLNTEKPQVLSGHDGNAVELSYWHEWPASYAAPNIGEAVVEDLVDIATETPFNSDLLWMVTLPEDVVKRHVCRQLGFEAIYGPQMYEIGDGATIPRQLWVRM